MISTRGRYALRMMLDLSEHCAEGYVSLKDIAARQEISKKYLEQIALQLTQAGLLHAARGHRGGYRLAKAPEEYTVGDILRLTEGSLAPVACVEDGVENCPKAENCVTLTLWKDLNDAINSLVDHVTLADLVERSENMGDFYSI